MPRRSAPKAGRVVRRTLADGSVREYRYAPYAPKERKQRGDTVGDLVEAWQASPEWRRLAKNTQDLYVRYSMPLLGMQNVLAARVERRDLMTIRGALAETRGNGAANAFTRVAATLFGWAIENGWLKHSPCVKIRQLESGHLPAWTMAEAERAMASLPEHLRRVVVLALHTGQRRGDLIGLPWSAYDGRALRLRQEKTGAQLVIPCHPALKAELDAWRRTATSTLILTNWRGHPWAETDVSKRLQLELAKIPGFRKGLNIHGLRKLAAARLAEAGCSLHEIASITGHRSLGMLQLYTKSVDQERLSASAIAKLGDLRA